MLGDDKRISLNLNMFHHVLSILYDVFPPDRLVVVSRSSALLDVAHNGGSVAHRETTEGLNAALREGARIAVERGATQILTMSSDLPFLAPDDIRALLATEGDVVVATDRARTGTNALLLRRPFGIDYRYGEASLSAHLAAAEDAGLAATVVDRPGLARDIDMPSDLGELDDFQARSRSR